MKSNFAHHSERNVGRRKLSTVSQGIWALFRKSIPHQLIQIPGRSWLIPQISFLLQAVLLFSRPMAPIKVFFGALKHRTGSPFLRELPKLFGSIAVEQILSTRNFYLRTKKLGTSPGKCVNRWSNNGTDSSNCYCKGPSQLAKKNLWILCSKGRWSCVVGARQLLQPKHGNKLPISQKADKPYFPI